MQQVCDSTVEYPMILGDVIAYTSNFHGYPLIPEKIFVREHDIIQVIGYLSGEIVEMGEASYQRLVDAKKVRPISFSVPFRFDSWLCIEETGVTWFQRAEEASWRAEKATGLLKQAGTLVNPMQVLGCLQACAHIVGLELKSFLQTLENSRKSAGETLVDIFQRIKNPQT